MSAGALPQAPLEKLTAFPQTSYSWFKGAASRQEGNGGNRGGERRKGAMGKGEERGKLGE